MLWTIMLALIPIIFFIWLFRVMNKATEKAKAAALANASPQVKAFVETGDRLIPVIVAIIVIALWFWLG